MRSSLVVFIACTLLTSAALAQSPCEQTFPERLRAVKHQLHDWAVEHDTYAKAKSTTEGKAMEFFAQHCRILSELERAVRKLDDPLSFVCDPSAGKKPKALTTRLIAESGGTVEVAGPSLHGTSMQNHDCRKEDPVDLTVNSDFKDAENGAKMGLVLCYQDADAQCEAVRKRSEEVLELIRQLKAEGKR